MKICIPVEGKSGWDERICEHFGRAPAYALIDLEKMELDFIENISDHFGGTKKPPEIIADTGANIVLACGMGPMAMNMLFEKGLKVYCGISGTVKESFEAFQNGKLSLATSELACKDHKH